MFTIKDIIGDVVFVSIRDSNQLKDIGLNKIDKRLKKYLVKKTENKDDKTIYSTHKFIANELGTSRVVISRILKKFEKLGEVELSRGSIKLKNVS